MAAEKKRKAKDLAKLMELTEAQVSQVISRGAGIGYHTIKGMAKVLGITVEELETRALAAYTEQPVQLRAVRDGDYLVNGDMPGWPDAESAAREQMTGMPPWTFEVARQYPNVIPRDGVTVQYVIDEALKAFKYASPDQAIHRTNEDLDREVTRLRKPASRPPHKKR